VTHYPGISLYSQSHVLLIFAFYHINRLARLLPPTLPELFCFPPLLFTTFQKEFGLNLNPFPKSVNTYLDYHDEDIAEEKENPFSVLKTLKKED
jgi:hypothetical protein